MATIRILAKYPRLQFDFSLKFKHDSKTKQTTLHRIDLLQRVYEALQYYTAVHFSCEYGSRGFSVPLYLFKPTAKETLEAAAGCHQQIGERLIRILVTSIQEKLKVDESCVMADTARRRIIYLLRRRRRRRPSS